MPFHNKQNSYYSMKDYDFSTYNGNFFNNQRPQIMLSEDDNNYYVRVLIAGLGSDDFELKLKENQLEIEAQFSGPSGKYLVQERSLGKFIRQINFNSCIDKENIHSEFSNGLLYVVLAKSIQDEISIESEEIKKDDTIEIEVKNEKE